MTQKGEADYGPGETLVLIGLCGGKYHVMFELGRLSCCLVLVIFIFVVRKTLTCFLSAKV